MTLQIDENFARYILSLQATQELEAGLEDDDYKYHEMIYDAFPRIKEEKEMQEFRNWIWTEKVENTPEVKSLKNKYESTGEGIRFSVRGIAKISKENEKIQKKLSKILDKINKARNRIADELYNDPKTKKEWKAWKAIQKMKGNQDGH
jgi:hypothetical protein